MRTGAAAERRQQRLGAEVDQVGSADELQRHERRLGGDEQRGEPRTGGECPDRLPARHSERRREPGRPAAEQRVADRERRVLSGRDDHDHRNREEGCKALDHKGRVTRLGAAMEQAHDHHGHHHHELPTSGRALDAVALSATLHCLTGCAVGEVLGVVIGTALGWSSGPTIALAILLAFLFGYAFTSVPLLRAGLALATVIPIALASDTFSIATMEIVDNAIILLIPGAMEAGLGDLMFWASLAVALALAGVAAFPVNRWLIARGKGHVAVHNTGIHGGPSPRVVGSVAVVAGLLGSLVLLVEAIA